MTTLYVVLCDKSRHVNPYYGMTANNARFIEEDGAIHFDDEDGMNNILFPFEEFYLTKEEADEAMNAHNAALRPYNGNSVSELYKCARHNRRVLNSELKEDNPWYLYRLAEEMRRLTPSWPWIECEGRQHTGEHLKCAACIVTTNRTKEPVICEIGLGKGVDICVYHLMKNIWNNDAATVRKLAAIGLAP